MKRYLLVAGIALSAMLLAFVGGLRVGKRHADAVNHLTGVKISAAAQLFKAPTSTRRIRLSQQQIRRTAGYVKHEKRTGTWSAGGPQSGLQMIFLMADGKHRPRQHSAQ